MKASIEKFNQRRAQSEAVTSTTECARLQLDQPLAVASVSSKQENVLHLYSPELAKRLNEKQPDVTAAVILYNLSLWQRNNYSQTLIQGRRHSFRSLNELHEDHPYLKKSAIHKAIQRLEEGLGDNFRVRRDKDKLWFSIGERTMKAMERGKSRWEKDHKAMHGLLVDDAKLTDVRTAVILSNLKYMMAKFPNPLKDDEGNKYGELSPKTLCSILGYSEDTIARSIKELRGKDLIKAHPERKSFYALSEGFVMPKTVASSAKTHTAEVHSETAEVHSRPAEVHTQPAEVHTQPAEVHSTHVNLTLEPLKTQGFQRDAKLTCINECLNPCLNGCFKGCIKTATATQRCLGSSMSKGARMLMELVESKLAQLREKNASGHVYAPARVHEDSLPYDFIVGPYEYPYDIVTDHYGPSASEVDDDVRWMKVMWKEEFNLKLDADDEAKLRCLLHDNPQIDGVDLFTLYKSLPNIDKVWVSLRKQELTRHSILTKIRTPKAFLRYLPQIVVLMNTDDFEDHYDGVIEEPWKNFNYSFLGSFSNQSAIVKLDGGDVPKLYVECD